MDLCNDSIYLIYDKGWIMHGYEYYPTRLLKCNTSDDVITKRGEITDIIMAI